MASPNAWDDHHNYDAKDKVRGENLPNRFPKNGHFPFQALPPFTTSSQMFGGSKILIVPPSLNLLHKKPVEQASRQMLLIRLFGLQGKILAD